VSGMLRHCIWQKMRSKLGYSSNLWGFRLCAC